MVFFLQDWAKGNRGRNNDTFTSTWRRRRKNNNNNNIVWLSWSKTETNFRVTCGFFVVPKKRTRIELKKHKFNINHMLKGWCLEKKRMGVKKASRNYTDFLNSIHRPGKTLLFFFLARPLVVQLVVPLRNVWHKLTLLHKTINTCHLFSGNCVMMIHLALSLCIDFHTKLFFTTF